MPKKHIGNGRNLCKKLSKESGCDGFFILVQCLHIRGQVDKTTYRHPRAKPKTPLDSSDHAHQFEGQKSTDPPHQVDQAHKRVPQVPVAETSGRYRAKPKAWLGSPECPDQPGGQKSPDPPQWIDQGHKSVSQVSVSIPSGHPKAKPTE